MDEKLRIELEDANQKLSLLSSQLREKDEELVEQNRCLIEKEEKLEMAVEVGRSLLHKNEFLSREKEELEKKLPLLKILEAKNAELQDTISDQKVSYEMLETRFVKLEEEHEQVTKNLGEYKKKLGREGTFKRENEELMNKTSLLTRRNTELIERDKKLSRELSQVQTDFEKEKRDGARYVREHGEIERLTIENHSLKKFEEKYLSLKKETSSLIEEREERESLREETEKLRRAVSNMVKVNKGLQQEADELKRQHIQATTTAAKYQKKIEELELELDHVRANGIDRSESLLNEILLSPTKKRTNRRGRRGRDETESENGSENDGESLENFALGTNWMSPGSDGEASLSDRTTPLTEEEEEREENGGEQDGEENGEEETEEDKGEDESLKGWEAATTEEEKESEGGTKKEEETEIESQILDVIAYDFEKEILSLTSSLSLEKYFPLWEPLGLSSDDEDFDILGICLDDREEDSPSYLNVQKIREDVSSGSIKTQESWEELVFRLLEKCEDQSSKILRLHRLACRMKRERDYIKKQEQLFLGYVMDCRVLLDASHDTVMSKKMNMYIDRLELLEISGSVIDDVSIRSKDILSVLGELKMSGETAVGTEIVCQSFELVLSICQLRRAINEIRKKRVMIALKKAELRGKKGPVKNSKLKPGASPQRQQKPKGFFSSWWG